MRIMTFVCGAMLLTGCQREAYMDQPPSNKDLVSTEVRVAELQSKVRELEADRDRLRDDLDSIVSSARPAPRAKAAKPDTIPRTTGNHQCWRRDDYPDGPYMNEKICLMESCDKGDKAACKEMEGWFGNMYPPSDE
jgi:outer membrane murein-binding lipoprotein Lpp